MRRDEIHAVYREGLDAVVLLVERLFSIIETQQIDIEALKTQVKELQERLATNSSNSNKPPSSDGFNKQTRSLRKKSKKKSGGQFGHHGSRLTFSDNPDSLLLHHPQSCLACGASLEHVPAGAVAQRRQVFDLPPVTLQVTEHRVGKKTCLCCGAENVGEFPPAVPPGASYGERIKGFLLYLHKSQLLPVERSCQVVEDLFAHHISQGTLHNITSECSAELAEVCDIIRAGIIKSEVANFDETGSYVAGRRDWLHTASTRRLTFYECDPQRGRAAIERIGILPKFHGVACHDAYSSYLSYACLHSLCNAHHLRELSFLAEVQDREWSREMKALLLKIKERVEKAGHRGVQALCQATQTKFAQAYQSILQRGFEREQLEPVLETGKRGRKKQSKAKNLLDRLEKYQGETLRFMRDFSVPFDNNLAERDLRMMKVQQKISGCFRTKEGAADFCRIRSYLSTMKKQGHNLLEALRSAFAGNPIVPDTG